MERSTWREIVESAVRVDWSLIEPRPALRCAIAVAVPLLAGVVLGRPSIGVFGAVGALSVGFGSFQGAYRSRAAVMIFAALGMAASIVVGTLAGTVPIVSVLMAALWAFGAGLLVAIGPAAAFVGLQSAVAMIVASGFPADASETLGRFLLVLGGGLLQALLVVIVWPLRRFPAERRLLGGVYLSLSEYVATGLLQDAAAPPESQTLLEAESARFDPQPFATVDEIAVFQALFDEAERLRAGVASLANHRRWLASTGASAGVQAVDELSAGVARVLAEIGAAIEDGRAPAPVTEVWRTIDTASRATALRADHSAIEALLGQLRAAWRTVGVFSTDADERKAAADGGGGETNGTEVSGGKDDADAPDPRLRPLPKRPFKEALRTLAANLSLKSTACRHALRLALSVTLASGIAHTLSLQRGYWLTLTVLLILRPEFKETFARGLARIAGTLLGAMVATLITVTFQPQAFTLTVLVLVFIWLGYTVFRASYTLFTFCITGYVVFLVVLAGSPEAAVATTRAIDTVLGGALALLVFAIWPTWEATQVRDALAILLDAQGRYGTTLLAGYADPARLDRQALYDARVAARLARSNAEASVDRMLGEPKSRRRIEPQVAVGVLAAVRRYALSNLALQAGLEGSTVAPLPAVRTLEQQIHLSFGHLAEAVRLGTPPPPLPPLRETQLALPKSSHLLVVRETDQIVDSINTIAGLLAR